jgi:predicted outer membrane protein
METLKNFAIISIAACTIATVSASQSSFAMNKHFSRAPLQQTDTLSTEQFIQQVSVGSNKEINLSKLAREKSKNSKIREYATKVMDACILANSDLKPLAATKNITLADSTTVEPDNITTTLKQSKNRDFDKQYLSVTIEDHNQAIALLEKGVMARDTAVSSFATKTLVVWRKNLEEARFLSKNMTNSKMVADKPRKEGTK